MRVGLQLLVSAPDDRNPRAALNQAVQTAMLAEGLGFDVVWVSEHHHSALNLCPDPLTLLAHVAALTESIRLGTAIVNVPLTHPAFLAERIALLDNLSDGRLELGVGRGFAAADYAQAGLDPADAWDLFTTHHEALTRSLSAESVLRCAQEPSPPLWLAVSGSEQSLAFAAQHRHGLLLAGKVERLRSSVAVYRDIWRHQHGDRPADIGVSRAVHVAVSRDQAVTEVAEPLDWYRARMHDLQPETTPPPIEDIVDTFCILGTASDCITGIAQLHEASGLSMLNCVFGLGGMDADLTERSIIQFAEEVMPALRSGRAC